MADFQRMDLDAMMAHYAEDGVYDNPIKGKFNPPPGGIRGKANIRQAFAIVPTAFVRNDFIDNRTYTTSDDERLVLVENTCHCVFHNGTVYQNFIMYRFEVEQGLIHKLTEYVIDPAVQAAAWEKGMPAFMLP